MKVRGGVFGDLVMGILLIVFGIWVCIESLQMKIFSTFLDAPGLFPFILSILFVILGVMLLSSALRRKGLAAAKSILNAEFLTAFFKDEKTIRTLILIGLMAIYIFVLVGRVHFFIASVAYLVATMLYLKSTKLWKIIVISVIASALICVTFKYGFRIPLP